MGIVEFQTEDGTPLLVRVPADGPRSGPGAGGGTGQGELVTRGLGDSGVVQRAERSFEAALKPIRAVSEGVLAELRAAPRHPDSVTVEFGLEFTANSSAVVVGATGTASIRVELVWHASGGGSAASADG